MGDPPSAHGSGAAVDAGTLANQLHRYRPTVDALRARDPQAARAEALATATRSTSASTCARCSSSTGSRTRREHPPGAGRRRRILGQLDVDEVLELVARDTSPPAASEAVRGELVSAGAELVEAFAATLVASPQTQRTYRRACRRFLAWLGPHAGPPI